MAAADAEDRRELREEQNRGRNASRRMSAQPLADLNIFPEVHNLTEGNSYLRNKGRRTFFVKRLLPLSPDKFTTSSLALCCGVCVCVCAEGGCYSMHLTVCLICPGSLTHSDSARLCRCFLMSFLLRATASSLPVRFKTSPVLHFTSAAASCVC